MPTYKNETNHSIYWGARSWAPGEEKPVPFFVPDEAGLTKTSDEPVPLCPILLSQDVTVPAGEPVELQIPYPQSGEYSLSAVAVSGSAVLSLGGKDITLDSTADYSGFLSWGQIASISLSCSENASVRILVEEG